MATHRRAEIMSLDLRNLTSAQLADFLETLGLPGNRAPHIFRWLFHPGNTDISSMGIVKKELRQVIEKNASINVITPSKTETAKDGTVKFSFRLHDGVEIESVLIPGPRRHTLCVSSQAGCAMGCAFCLTGRMGLIRNLRPSEIVGQVMAVMEFMVSNGVVRS
ncbi:MAG: hypothetical protein Q8J76_09795, partial [Desulfobulbaceae bacterium]|nr:hypothetical protein [Desulfobulbaceae bacterium]